VLAAFPENAPAAILVRGRKTPSTALFCDLPHLFKLQFPIASAVRTPVA